MKKQLWAAYVGLSALATVHCNSFAGAVQQDSSGVSLAGNTNQPTPKDIEKECEDEWKANRDAMIKGGMPEDSYVRQCVVRDDVPAIPESKTKATPSSKPK